MDSRFGLGPSSGYFCNSKITQYKYQNFFLYLQFSSFKKYPSSCLSLTTIANSQMTGKCSLTSHYFFWDTKGNLTLTKYISKSIFLHAFSCFDVMEIFKSLFLYQYLNGNNKFLSLISQIYKFRFCSNSWFQHLRSTNINDGPFLSQPNNNLLYTRNFSNNNIILFINITV